MSHAHHLPGGRPIRCRASAFPGRKDAGFTLTEILVVIGIIAILIALLFPFINSSMASARTSKCLSNMHTLGGLLLSYAGDNNGMIPPGQDVNGKAWNQFLDISSPDVLQCPADTYPRPPHFHARSYAINDQLWTPAGNASGGIRILNIAQPAQTVLLSEWHAAGNMAESSGDGTANGYIGNPPQNFQAHGASGNILWFDGHGSNVKASDATKQMFLWTLP